MTDVWTLAEVVAAVERRFDPKVAEKWDRVGLVCGDPHQPVTSVMFAVDPLRPVVDEAIESGAQLLVTHHPLLLAPVHGVPATTAKGKIVHDLIRAGCGLLTVHTNADVATDGVSDAIADAIGLVSRRPIRPIPDRSMVKIVVNVLPDNAEAVIDAMADAGAGRIGDYDRCAYWVDGAGQFRPLPGAVPHVGSVGQTALVLERKVEMVAHADLVPAVVESLREAHSYEEPAFDVIDLVDLPGGRGLGRVGTLESAMTVTDLARRLSAALPLTAHGVRVAGDPDAEVRTVAVCGGAGDSLLGEVRRINADAYVTGDLRHHPVTEHLADGGCPVVDISHWAGEWLWLRHAADFLHVQAASGGVNLECRVSDIVTDPWTLHVGSTV
ncbi:MAG: Nif3-like dinuclear metal center hexameric protein [Candidatus Nanopelagicales bacterium]|nr:Nif3-like dinuclear metal center hexameric protein [Candidatus Nanopelagicales bacterium]